jgi:hypothetical protein
VTLLLKGHDEMREVIGRFTITDQCNDVLDWNVPERPGTYQIELYVTAKAPETTVEHMDAFLRWFDNELGVKNRSETIVVIE